MTKEVVLLILLIYRSKLIFGLKPIYYWHRYYWHRYCIKAGLHYLKQPIQSNVFERKYWCVAAFLWLQWLLPLLTDESLVLPFCRLAAIFQHSMENGWEILLPRPHPVSSKLCNISISETVYVLLRRWRENSSMVNAVGPGIFFNLKKL